MDGVPRGIARSVEVLAGQRQAVQRVEGVEGAGLAEGGADFATIVTFLTAPVLGYLNLRAVTGPDMPAEHRPGRALRALSWLALLVLAGFGVVYLLSLLG